MPLALVGMQPSRGSGIKVTVMLSAGCLALLESVTNKVELGNATFTLYSSGISKIILSHLYNRHRYSTALITMKYVVKV